jgi:hypothetical protein
MPGGISAKKIILQVKVNASREREKRHFCTGTTVIVFGQNYGINSFETVMKPELESTKLSYDQWWAAIIENLSIKAMR